MFKPSLDTNRYATGRGAAAAPGSFHMVVKRNPDATRATILQAAFDEIYRNGFRAASVDKILADTGLTKGALYHHFPNKAALGYAVVDEIIGGYIRAAWVEPLHKTDDPVQALLDLLSEVPDEKLRMTATVGCPLNNLAQEMSAIDEEFRQHIDAVFREWREGVEERLSEGQRRNFVRSDVDCRQAAAFLVAAIEGGVGLAKTAQDPELLKAAMAGLRNYLVSLRPAQRSS